jgi:hypothetical protein
LALSGTALLVPLGACSAAHATQTPWNSTYGLSPFITTDNAVAVDDNADNANQHQAQAQAEGGNQPVYLDAATPEQPNIHGFFNSPFKTAYVTPRGLVVQNAGLVWQPVVGLVLPLGDFGPFKDTALIGGIWNSVNTAESGINEFTGAWNEMDVFVGLSAKVAKDFSLALTYGAWNSPPHNFHTEHNLDLKVAYDDSHFFGDSGFGFHPYVDLWWAISGDSTVILGKKGDTGYVELGLAPTYTIKATAPYPVTLTMPIYTQVGPRDYWADHGLPGGNVGLVSASLNASVPLAFIPTRYGFWHADLGVNYYYLINDSLLMAGTIASGNDNRNVVVGSVGFGFNF